MDLLEHGPPIECNSLIQDVEVETRLSKEVVSFTLLFLFISISCGHTLARSNLKPSRIRMTLTSIPYSSGCLAGLVRWSNNATAL